MLKTAEFSIMLSHSLVSLTYSTNQNDGVPWRYSLSGPGCRKGVVACTLRLETIGEQVLQADILLRSYVDKNGGTCCVTYGLGY